MHLLKAQGQPIGDGTEAVDLDLTPADVVIVSAADTEIAGLARAHAAFGAGAPSLRLASLQKLRHNMSVDLFLEKTVARSKLLVLRLLGGAAYWPYGVEEAVRMARRHGVKLAVMPGCHNADPDLVARSTVPADEADRLWRLLVEGGPANLATALDACRAWVDGAHVGAEAIATPAAGLYWPGLAAPDLDAIVARWADGAPAAPIVFYRAQYQAGDVAAIDALIAALVSRGLGPLPIFVSSLKEAAAAAFVRETFAAVRPAVVLNTTVFAVSKPGAVWAATPLDSADAPVLQVALAAMDRATWEASPRGLSARDLAMGVALPEIDGRIFTRAIAFKTAGRVDAATETEIVAFEAAEDRVAFVADLAANWARLRTTPRADRRVALILANYPTGAARLANGVGLDTPQSTAVMLDALRSAGYAADGAPETGAAVVEAMTAALTTSIAPAAAAHLSLAAYTRFLEALPAAAQGKMLDRWGLPESDPTFDAQAGGFRLAVRTYGALVLGVQPSRGFDVDPKAAHHDPDLPPPHGHLAFYVWLREVFGVHAIVHVGKHGNLEWLPGKSLALSDTCYPEIALGPLPHVYPFIVNDPGEGAAAKRRAAAVIVDHLTPPLARAEGTADLREVETLVDEYAEAQGLDPRRAASLAREILTRAASLGLDRDCGFSIADDPDDALTKLDAFLCEVKELQVRNGLHVFGRSPTGAKRAELLVALVRSPRGARPEDASLTRALAGDLGLDGFDPLKPDFAAPWTGPRPAALAEVSDEPWRTAGDTVERLERLALRLAETGAGIPPRAEGVGRVAPPEAASGGVRDVEGHPDADPTRPGFAGPPSPVPGEGSRAVLRELATVVAPRVDVSGAAEIDGLLRALDGRFVAPGPSGAPTRARLDALPTGRNFFALDPRSAPTEAAWRLGRTAADVLCRRHFQDHGEWPRRLAISAWGTANMRTGGDDIAQALALMGVAPQWEAGSSRVVGLVPLPLAELQRPRVDVLFRISGFFRDAFPFQIDLIDEAVRLVGALDEDDEANPIGARLRAETEAGRAGHSVFGAAPGAYGTGLAPLLDAGAWETRADLAEAYLTSSGFAYAQGVEGTAARAELNAIALGVDGVVQTQDAREFDLLDSDDVHEFAGGLSAAVETLKGAAPAIYHLDTSRTETPVVRSLKEEIALVVRARATNPKWIDAMREHGHKGAAEMLATVTNLSGFAATTDAVGSHQFDALYGAYLGDEAVRGFIADANPAALAAMARAFLEAERRGFWRPTRNSAMAQLETLAIPPLGRETGDGEAGRVGSSAGQRPTSKTPPDLGLTAETTLPALAREEG
ncbi:cobaltochelatase CobN [Methylopila capsulata]|uniref:Cobaltochelatase subunit CobN n=1 Tax=Methylopila capsulata TaxID=61654 RepID=A0A9W6MRA1_9HYPH|nr:cobaltochelatase subunit CobN [Methylopila capsulata]MBM7850203.1 cobaltochelatase CobN [Methylopila capsulata]GLK55495.1 cobaltochelatase subunit CobN [Methylopila capsulata]